MLFNSGQFLVFFPIVLILYYVLPQKFRKYFLLIASFYFYMCWSAQYIVLILISIIITFLGGIFIQKTNDNKAEENIKRKHKNLILFGVLSSNLLILFVFKYFNFFFSRLFQILGFIGLNFDEPVLNLLLPVGISFYTFQALSYTIDVYRGTIKAENRFVNYALFVSFFPQLVAGPIERSGKLLPQIDNLKGFDYSNFTDGLKLMLFGFFQKVVLADNIAIAVNTVYNDVNNYFGAQVLIATVLFAIQIYCDFAGYSNIAIGCAKCMGIKLMQNFNTPYFASSVKEFWHRWHISLSTWFKDYLYIPLGGSRRGKLRTYINVIIVFVVSGLWHGAELTFVFWGLLHGIYQVTGEIFSPVKAKISNTLQFNKHSVIYKISTCLVTFIFVDFAWIFFRANNLSESFIVIKNLFNLNYYSFDYFNLTLLGLTNTQSIVIVIGILVLFIASLMQYNNTITSLSQKIPSPLKWAGYIIAVNVVLAFGSYGTMPGAGAQFIYFQF